jgi:hypothetical protein
MIMKRLIVFLALLIGVYMTLVRRLILRWKAAHTEPEQDTGFVPSAERLETA